MRNCDENSCCHFSSPESVLLFKMIVSDLSPLHPKHYCDSRGKNRSLVLARRMVNLLASSGCQESRPPVGNSRHVSALGALHADPRRQTQPLPPIPRLWDALLRCQTGSAGLGEALSCATPGADVANMTQAVPAAVCLRSCSARDYSSHQFSEFQFFSSVSAFAILFFFSWSSCLMLLIRFSGFRWRTRSAT